MKTGNNPLTLTTRRFHIYIHIHTYIHVRVCVHVCVYREREREKFEWTSGGQIQTAVGGKLNGK